MSLFIIVLFARTVLFPAPRASSRRTRATSLRTPDIPIRSRYGFRCFVKLASSPILSGLYVWGGARWVISFWLTRPARPVVLGLGAQAGHVV